MRRLATAVLLIASVVATAAPAQSEKARRKPVPHQGYQNQNRGTVSTYPSNSPFSNPISQPLPPAVSINPAQNSNRSSVPIQGYR